MLGDVVVSIGERRVSDPTDAPPIVGMVGSIGGHSHPNRTPSAGEVGPTTGLDALRELHDADAC